MDRTADVFIVTSRAYQYETILRVLKLRQEEVLKVRAVSQGQAEEAIILDRGACFRIDKVLYLEYLGEPDMQKLKSEVWDRAKRLAGERRASRQRTSSKDVYDRSMRSYWKTTVFNRYGGEIWLFTLIAMGRLHPISVGIVNEIFARRIRDQAEREPVSEPATAQPQTQARASSQGQVRGVQHQKIYAGKLRDQARLADKKRRWHDDDWQKAHRRRSIRARDTEWWSRNSAQLRQEAGRLWTGHGGVHQGEDAIQGT